jgi:hypothetical protein
MGHSVDGRYGLCFDKGVPWGWCAPRGKCTENRGKCTETGLHAPVDVLLLLFSW